MYRLTIRELGRETISAINADALRVIKGIQRVGLEAGFTDIRYSSSKEWDLLCYASNTSHPVEFMFSVRAPTQDVFNKACEARWTEISGVEDGPIPERYSMHHDARTGEFDPSKGCTIRFLITLKAE